LFLVIATWSFLPIFVVELGGDNFDVGLVMGSLGITSLGCLPFVAPLIDRYGRKPFIMGGILLIGTTNGGFMLFDHYSHSMIIVRLIQGVAFAACFNACATAVVDILPPEKRAQGIGLFGISGSLAIAVGPYVGEMLLLRWGFHAYFLLLAAFGGIGFLMALLVKEPPRKTGPLRAQGFFRTALQARHMSLMLVAATFGAGFAVMSNFFPLYAKSLGIKAGVFFFCYGVSLVLVRVSLGQVADHCDREKLILACLAAFGIILTATSQVASTLQTMLLGALFGVGQGLSYPAMMARMVDNSNDSNRAVVVALFTGSFGVGIHVSMPIWGLIANLKGLPFMFLAGGLAMLAGTVVGIAYWSWSRACCAGERALPDANPEYRS